MGLRNKVLIKPKCCILLQLLHETPLTLLSVSYMRVGNNINSPGRIPNIVFTVRLRLHIVLGGA